jgi:hypothetical protein
MISGPIAQSGVDPMVDRLGLAVDALSVDAKQDLHTVPGTGSNLRCGHPGVKPQ